MTALSLYEFTQACQKPGCPACRMIYDAVQKHISKLFYEKTNRVEVRQDLRQSLGFCSEHAWQALDTSAWDILGIAIIYQDILGAVLRELPYAPPEPASSPKETLLSRFHLSSLHLSPSRKAVQALTPKGPCPVCQQGEIAADRVMATLLEGLVKEDFVAALAASQGLCLPHLRQVCEHLPAGRELETLVGIHRAKISALRAELSEIIRKYDYRFSQEPVGDEREAWRRVVNLAVGRRPITPDN